MSSGDFEVYGRLIPIGSVVPGTVQTLGSAASPWAGLFLDGLFYGSNIYLTSVALCENLNSDLWDNHHFAEYFNQQLLTTSSPTFNAITGTSFTIGANTLNTTEWAFLDGIDQAVKTTSAVRFGSVKIGASAVGNYNLNIHGGGTETWIQLQTTTSGTGSEDGMFFGMSGINGQMYAEGTLTFYSGYNGAGGLALTLTAAALATFTGRVSSPYFVSTIATGTAPVQVTSTTVNTNLNADLWDGYQFSDYLNQAVKTTSSPTFEKVSVNHIGENTASHTVIMDNDVTMTSGKKLLFAPA